MEACTQPGDLDLSTLSGNIFQLVDLCQTESDSHFLPEVVCLSSNKTNVQITAGYFDHVVRDCAEKTGRSLFQLSYTVPQGLLITVN